MNATPLNKEEVSEPTKSTEPAAPAGGNRRRTFLLNAGTSYIRVLLSMGILFLTTPYIIRHLGTNDFGLWSLVMSVMGLAGLLDAGLGTGAVKYVAECRGSGDINRRNRMVSTVFAAYLVLAGVGVLVLTILSLKFNAIFHIPVDQQAKAIGLLWILGMRMVVLALPLSLFQGILFGEQRSYVINVIQVAALTAYAFLLWKLLGQGMGIVTLAWLNLVTMLGEYGAYTVFAYRLMPGLRVSLALMDRGLLREVIEFSGAQLLVNVAVLVRARTDPLIIKCFLPMTAVAAYAVALRLSECLMLLIKQVINLMSPLVAEFKTAGDHAKLKLILLSGTKFVFAISGMVSLAVCLFAGDITRFWIGANFANVAPVLIVLTLAMWLVVPQLVAANILVMTGHHRFSARAQVVGMLINLGLSIFLTSRIGLIGAALGTLVATVIIDLAYVLIRACALNELSYLYYVRKALVPAFVAAAPQIAITVAIKRAHPPTSLLYVLLEAIPGVVAFGLTFILLYVTAQEKHLLLGKRFKRDSAPVLQPAA